MAIRYAVTCHCSVSEIGFRMVDRLAMRPTVCRQLSGVRGRASTVRRSWHWVHLLISTLRPAKMPEALASSCRAFSSFNPVLGSCTRTRSSRSAFTISPSNAPRLR